jgi:hypothetical protein
MHSVLQNVSRKSFVPHGLCAKRKALMLLMIKSLRKRAEFCAIAYVPFSSHSCAQAGYSAPFNGNIVRADVNYHFNGAGPVPIVAKY